MSMILSLTSAAVVACISMSSVTAMQLLESKANKKNETEGIETVFTDAAILVKTLESSGCCVKQISENEYSIETVNGILRYVRNHAGEAFRLMLDQIQDRDALIAEIRSFELDYGRNVQTYTYHHIKENLADNMTIADEQVLEDDSLLLTIEL